MDQGAVARVDRRRPLAHARLGAGADVGVAAVGRVVAELARDVHPLVDRRRVRAVAKDCTMRVELIGHFNDA